MAESLSVWIGYYIIKTNKGSKVKRWSEFKEDLECSIVYKIGILYVCVCVIERKADIYV